jgi:glutathione S-transferase
MARVLLRELDIPCEEKLVEEFPPSPEYFQINPLGQVPVLLDGNNRFFPTSIILKHIIGKSVGSGKIPSADRVNLRVESSIEQEQLLAVLLAMGDLIATTIYLRWAGMTGSDVNKLGFDPAQRNLQRVMNTLDWLERRAGDAGFNPPSISVPDIVIACLILWTESRGPITWRGRPNLESIVARLETRASFLTTAPLPLVGYD